MSIRLRIRSRLEKSPVWLGLLLFVLGTFLSIMVAMSLAKAEDRRTRERLDRQVEVIRTTLHDRMDANGQILRGAGALWRTGEVSRVAWRLYVESLELDSTLPGVLGVGWSRAMTPAEKPLREMLVRSEGFPAYALRPAGERPFYTGIEYIEPFTGRNLRAFGYDMWSESVRRQAMERAMLGGGLTLSGKVTLVQENEKEPQAGCLIFLAVYDEKAPLIHGEDRRRALKGWVYSPYRMGDLMRAALDKRLGEVDVAVYDGTNAVDGSLMYQSRRTAWPKTRWKSRFQMDVFGATWTVDVGANERFLATEGRSAAVTVGVSGTLVSLLLSLVFLTLQGARRRAESLAARSVESLKAGEERLKVLFEKSPVGLFETDGDREGLSFNGYFREMTGLGDRELKGRGFLNALAPEDRGAFEDDWIQAHTWRRSFSFSLRILGHSPRWMEGQIAPLTGEDGAIRGWVGMGVDVTARRSALAALAESELRFDLAFRGSNDGIWDWNLREGTLWFSPRWKSQLGYEDHELENTLDMWGRVIHPEDREKAMALVEDYNHGRVLSFEQTQRFLHKDGSTVWILSRAQHQRDETGRAIRLVGSHTNLTPMVLADNRRKRQGERIRALYLLTSNPALDEGAQVKAALDLGLQWFGLGLGLICEPVGDGWKVQLARPPRDGGGVDDALGGDLCRRIEAQRDPLAIRHASLEEGAPVGEGRFEALLAMPLTLDGKTVGILCFSSAMPKETAFDEDDLTLLGLLGQWTVAMRKRMKDAAILETQRMELKHLATTDPLTGLMNRRAFEEDLARHYNLATRHGRPLSFLMIDIDHFKRVNDQWGHGAGDGALKIIADLLQEIFRRSDLICRWGGEEFAVALPETTEEKALEASQRLARRVEGSPMALVPGQEPVHLTVSIGVTIARPGDRHWEVALDRADEALYRAKAEGRNRVIRGT